LIRQLVDGIKDGVGCLFGALVGPAVVLIILLAFVKLGDFFFPDDPYAAEQQCKQQKQSFQKEMLCEASYEIGEQFLKDPTSTFVCADSQISQRIKSRSFLFKFRLDSCSRTDAQFFSQNIMQYLSHTQATFSVCEKGFDGRDLVPAVQQQFGAFLACRSYRAEP
jgi:hypothetical protein